MLYYLIMCMNKNLHIPIMLNKILIKEYQLNSYYTNCKNKINIII